MIVHLLSNKPCVFPIKDMMLYNWGRVCGGACGGLYKHRRDPLEELHSLVLTLAQTPIFLDSHLSFAFT